MKKSLYQVHKWTGITLGFFLFLLAISGLGITFREELLPRLYPDLFHITPGEAFASLDLLYQKATQHLGVEGLITNLYSTHHADEAWLFLYRTPGDWFPTMLTINPFNGDIVGEMSMIKNFFAIMLFLHANLFLGTVGNYFVGLLGLVLVFFVVSGIYVWWPHKDAKGRLLRTFKMKSLKDSQKSHHILGIVFAIPFLISALTGFLTVFDLSYYIVRPLKGEPVRVEEMARVSSCTFEEQLNVLKSLPSNIHEKLISVHFCTKKNGLMKVSTGLKDQDFLDGYERILIDPKNGEVLQTFNSDKDPYSWNIKRLFMFPLHTGEYYGMFGKSVNFLTGMGLMFIWFTGLKLFLKRRALRRNDRHL